MKRLEGMIYGERLASEESKGRRENSLKVVEITKSAEGGGWCGGRCGGWSPEWVMLGWAWEREPLWEGYLPGPALSAALSLGVLGMA